MFSKLRFGSRASFKTERDPMVGTVKCGQSDYPCRPTSLDAMIQLGLAFLKLARSVACSFTSICLGCP
ncbi:unnamed protein product [Penicillium camemberti]|uniref:Str. FM013 n=1 Tax=Penicillium camemberti (strain FM 013) TaxID=1429867 RepID=A0A0G4PB29_PENC3|nr:unnamed protein product [Penicillium camemberti]